jgi:catechol 2,3-dioxygenase-like lactoylglutathione lyase family enzyme
MAPYRARRAGVILAVADVAAAVDFSHGLLGFEVLARYDDPPYATLALAGTRLSLAEQGHDAPDRPGVELSAPADPARADVVLVVEVEDAEAAHAHLADRGVASLAEPYRPPWGGCRFFCRDRDGFLIEFEEPA